MRTISRPELALSVPICLSVCAVAMPRADAAQMTPITDDEVIEFVKTALDTADVSDAVLKEVLAEEYQGTTYLTWFKLAMLAYNTVGHAREGQYGYIVKDLCEAGVTKVVEIAGYPMVSGMMATTVMICDALDLFYRNAANRALNRQIGAYFEYRRMNYTEGDFADMGLCDGEGWLIPPSGLSYLGDAPRPVGLTPAQVMELSRRIYEIASQPGQVDKDIERLRKQLIAQIEEARKRSPARQPSFLARLGSFLGGMWDGLRNWLVPKVKAADFPCASVLAIRDYSAFYEGKPWERQGTKAGEEIEGPDGATYVWVPPGSFMMGASALQAGGAGMREECGDSRPTLSSHSFGGRTHDPRPSRERRSLLPRAQGAAGRLRLPTPARPRRAGAGAP